MTKTYCDRCGKECPREQHAHLAYSHYTITLLSEDKKVDVIDLCPECNEKLKTWMNFKSITFDRI